MNPSTVRLKRQRARFRAPTAALLLVAGLILAACGAPAANPPIAQPVAQVPPTNPPPSAVAAPTMSAPTVLAATAAPAPTVSAPTTAPAQPAAPACDGVATPAMTEGPYYTPNPPERTSLLEPGIPGTPLVITGYVLGLDCQPIPNALVDFWQADGNGVYDNAGYQLRGRQFTDAAGRYTLETVVPGLYPGRTEHIHVKVQAPNGPLLTSQLFFPGVAQNESDGIFDARLLLSIEETAGELAGAYNFVVKGG